MFENLRRAFKEAADNFREELNRDEVPEVVDGILKQMQEEITDTKAHIFTLEEQIKKALQLADMEAKEVATCERRAKMALKIGDEETARLAAEFAEKHEKHKEVQENKALALKQEMEMKKAEVQEMMGQFKEARAKRESLTATTGRAEARNSIAGADDLFDQMDRMAERIEGGAHQQAAEEELLEEFDGLGSSPRGPSPEDLAEARLRQLKREMGEE